KAAVVELARVKVKADVYGAGKQQPLASSSLGLTVTASQVDAMTVAVKEQLVQMLFKGEKGLQTKTLPTLETEAAARPPSNPADYKLGFIFKKTMQQYAQPAKTP
ncbi:MAG: hypothetical protein AABY13_00295, partial [Nanoarchaeota archaeon]